MKRTFLLLAVSCSVLMAACSDNKKTQQPANQPGHSGEPAWKLTLKSGAPEGQAEDQTKGFYGFTVLADGRYQLGPGPQGQVFSGTLSQEDFTTVTGSVSGLSGRLSMATSAQTAAVETAVTEDHIMIARNNGESAELLSVKGTAMSTTLASVDEAKALHTALSSLADKLYALPFPNACVDAAPAVESLYPAVQVCSQDADCAYLMSDYTPVEAGVSTFIFADACEWVQNLPVGNRELVKSNLSQLQDAYAKTQQACATVPNRCASWGYNIDTAETPAVCEAGMCRMNAAFR